MRGKACARSASRPPALYGTVASSGVRSCGVSGGGFCDDRGRGFVHAGSSSSWVSGVAFSVRPVWVTGRRDAGSACSVAAEEGVKHGQLHALLVSTAPRDHRALAVRRVEMMAIT